MKTVITLIFAFLSNMLFSQISLNIKIAEKSVKNTTFIIEFTLKNESCEDYVIPLESNKVKWYYGEDCDHNLETIEHYPYLSMSTHMIDVETDEDIHPFDYLFDPPINEPFKFKRKEIDPKKYVFDNLIFLKAKSEIQFERSIDVADFEFDYYFYNSSYYHLEKGKEYKFNFFHCPNMATTFDLLTPQQKKTLKRYKFFTGRLESNFVTFIYDE